jgi:hypothetical protein
MARPPKDTIRPKKIIQTTIKEAFKSYSIWALAYLLIVEIISLLYWNDVNYKNFYYPLLNQIAILLLLINIFEWRKRLNFCKFKKSGLIAFIIYYILEILAMIFKWVWLIDFANVFFSIFAFLLFVFIYNYKSKQNV